MSNWAGMANSVQENGILPSFFPADLSIPMVAPEDLERAATFARTMDRHVEIQEVPRDALEETFREFGFSDEAAASYACMTRSMIDGKTDSADEPSRGTTSLESFIAAISGT